MRRGGAKAGGGDAESEAGADAAAVRTGASGCAKERTERGGSARSRSMAVARAS